MLRGAVLQRCKRTMLLFCCWPPWHNHRPLGAVPKTFSTFSFADWATERSCESSLLFSSLIRLLILLVLVDTISAIAAVKKKKIQIIYHYQTFFLTHVIKLNKILRPHYYRSYGPLAVLFCLIVIVAVAVVVFSLETFAIAIFLIINSRLQVNCKWFHFTIPVSVLTSSPALLSSPKPEMPFHRASAWSRDRQHHNNFQRHKFDVKWIFNNWM